MEPRIDYSQKARGVYEAMLGLEKYLHQSSDIEEPLLDLREESPYYTDRERAALAWTEAVTMIRETHVPDPVYQDARREFSEKELADLTVAVAAINAWNRLAISARTVPGTYQSRKGSKTKSA